MLDAVIFDMDGVMFDTEPMWNTVWVPILEGLGVRDTQWALDHLRGTSGSSTDGVLERVAPGVLGDPAVIGIIVGVFLSVMTRQPVTSALTICMGIAAVMVLIPRMVSIMMEGLTPLGEAANEYMKRKVGEDAEIYIGMDIALGLGDPACITATGIMIPVTIGLAFLVPGMRFFPLGILAEVCYLAPMCVLTSKGNVLRTIICMTIMMYITLFFANMFAPYATQMMSVTGVHFDSMVTASHFGWNPGNLVVSFIAMLLGL